MTTLYSHTDLSITAYTAKVVQYRGTYYVLQYCGTQESKLQFDSEADAVEYFHTVVSTGYC